MPTRVKDIKQDITKKINEPLANGSISSDEFDQWLDSMRPATEEEMSAIIIIFNLQINGWKTILNILELIYLKIKYNNYYRRIL